MPVNSTHPDYDAATAAWQRARDVLAGEDALKAAGERYLPKLDAQTDDDYRAYKARAAFFNASARTLEALVGLVFRTDMTVKVPTDTPALSAKDGDLPTTLTCPADTLSRSHGRGTERRGSASPLAKAMAAFVADVDLVGTPLVAYAKHVVGEVIGLGRGGTLVDWGGERVAAVFYAAEQIINWRTELVDGRDTLTLVVLKENAEALKTETLKSDGEADEFEHATVEQMRVLKLVDGVAGGAPATAGGAPAVPRYLVVEVWQHRRKGKDEREWLLVERRTPQRLGRPLPAIPFIFHGPRHSQPAVAKLPLADIIALNLDHYRLDADFKHGLHYTALPTAYVAGFDPAKGILNIGSRTVWMTDNKDARAGFLEFTGQGLTTFERAQDRDERLMAVLGTRMLESQKRAYESAESIELRQTAENSALGAIAISVGQSLTAVLRWAYWWHSTEATPEAIGPEVVLVELNQDFNPRTLAGDELVAVVKAWEAGAISRETMMDLLRRGEVLPPGRSNEEEARLTAGNPKAEMRNPKGDEQQ